MLNYIAIVATITAGLLLVIALLLVAALLRIGNLWEGIDNLYDHLFALTDTVYLATPPDVMARVHGVDALRSLEFLYPEPRSNAWPAPVGIWPAPRITRSNAWPAPAAA